MSDYWNIPSSDSGNITPLGSGFYNPTGLTNNLYGFLEVYEGVKNIPYVDGSGFPSVGVGINLSGPRNIDHLTAYLTLLGISASDSRYNAIFADLNRTWSAQGGITATDRLRKQLANDWGSPFPTLTPSKIKDLWNQVTLSSTNLDSEYNKFVRLISNRGIDTTNILKSYEGIALMSLSFNGAVHSGDTLLRDLMSSAFNRADAWFQIRYLTNLHKYRGVASRRYAESEIFGLYSPSDYTSGSATPTNVSNNEALSIYAEFSKQTSSSVSYRQIAFSYENKFYYIYDSSKRQYVNQITESNDSLSSDPVTSAYINNDSPALSDPSNRTIHIGEIEQELAPAAAELVNTHMYWILHLIHTIH